MATIIKPSASIRQNYNDISTLCKESGEPVYLTKNGEGDLVVMDIVAFNKRESMLLLREKLIEVEEDRKNGLVDIDASEASRLIRQAIQEAIHVSR